MMRTPHLHNRDENYSTNMAKKMAYLDEYEEVKTILENITPKNESVRNHIAGKKNEIQILRTKRAYRNRGMFNFY